MANVIINDSNLTAIGNAIRAKNGTETLYKPREMAAAIEAIEVGGGGSGDGEISAVHQSMIDLTTNSSGTGGMKITLPKEAQRVPQYMFYNNNALSEVEFENHNAPDFTYIGRYAFFQNNYLRKFEFPDSLTNIDMRGFSGCWSLNFDKWPESLIEIGEGAFYQCSDLTISTLPKNLTTINGKVFQECYKLNITEIPEGVTYIGNYAFTDACDTSVTRDLLTIGSTVTSVGTAAFKGQNFKKVRFMGTPTSIASSAFSNSDVTDLYVPWTHSEVVANSPYGAINATIHYNVGPEDVIE